MFLSLQSLILKDSEWFGIQPKDVQIYSIIYSSRYLILRLLKDTYHLSLCLNNPKSQHSLDYFYLKYGSMRNIYITNINLGVCYMGILVRTPT